MWFQMSKNVILKIDMIAHFTWHYIRIRSRLNKCNLEKNILCITILSFITLYIYFMHIENFKKNIFQQPQKCCISSDKVKHFRKK